ncbi:MAG TPA: SGNH/GDSL hydrolase family protein [Polyangia bacterium]
MKNYLRLLGSMTAASCIILAGCGAADDSGGGSGGANGSGGSTGSGGNASGGATGSGGHGTGGSGTGSSGSGGSGSGGSASGGSSTGGSASGGSSTGGSSTGGSSTGGSSSGGMVGSGGHAAGGSNSGGTTGSGGQGTAGSVGGGGKAAGGSGATSAGGKGGGATGSGGSAGGSMGSAGTSGLYNPCPTNGDPCRILPVGDSITFGINQEGSYRIELFHKALMASQKITYTGTLQNGPAMVDNVAFPKRYEATSGITIAGISSQITNNKTLMMPSDIILVHIGTNDMYMTPAGAPDRLGSLIDQLITGMPNALIVVAKIIPLASSASAVATYNAAIPGVVKTRADAGKHVIMVDMNTGFPPNDMDAVHPTPTGYAWMGDVWYAALGSLFPK